MRVASKFAVVATLSLMLVSSGAFAQTRGGTNGGPVPPTTPGGPQLCVGTCPAPDAQATVYCSDKAWDLPKITARQVVAIGEQQRIHLAPVCDPQDRGLVNVPTHDVALGNVAGLRGAIEANPLLMAQLDQHGYRSIDVVGILLGSNAAVLYVHKV